MISRSDRRAVATEIGVEQDLAARACNSPRSGFCSLRAGGVAGRPAEADEAVVVGEIGDVGISGHVQVVPPASVTVLGIAGAVELRR